jgi:PIN domain-containing protein
MHLVLDTNILISNPEILSRGGDSIQFLLPQPAYQQFMQSRFADRAGDLLERASKAGRLHIIPTPNDTTIKVPFSKQIDYTDALILASALGYKELHTSQDVFFVSDDRPLVILANELGLKTATSKSVDDLIRSAPNGQTISRELSDAAILFTQSNRSYLISGFLLGLIVAAALLAAWHFRQPLGQTFPVWGLILGAGGIGISLFWFRSKYRLSYGIAEVIFGLFAAGQLANPSAYNSTFFIQLAACFYIIVRGLDNIEKGIEGTKIEPGWKNFFSPP